MDWLTVARKLLPYFIGFLIGAALLGFVQQMRIKGKEADIKACQANLKVSEDNFKVCKSANKTNEATIGSLQGEVKDALKGCDSRLAVKDKTLKNLKNILALKPGGNANGGNNEDKIENNGSSSGDGIFDTLNGMFNHAGNNSAAGSKGN
jgi:hypothetical protein